MPTFRILLIAALCASPLALPFSAAQAEPANPVKPVITGVDGAKLKRMPWHLGDMWWDIGEAATKEQFQTLDLEFTIKGKVSDDANLYIAPTGGSGGVAGQDFYGGVQTNSLMNRTWAQPGEHQRRSIGRGAIFSTWDDRSTDSIATPADGYFDSAGHEGDFISVRHKFQWGEGRYTYRVQRLMDGDDNGKKRAWIGAFIIDHQTGECTWVGALRLKNSDLHLTRRLSAFVEIYGGRRPLETLPFGLEVTFFAPKINGKAIPDPHVMDQYDPGLPDLMTSHAVDIDGRELADPKDASKGKPAGLRFKLGTHGVVREKRRNWVF
jgi:hypothetical protein